MKKAFLLFALLFVSTFAFSQNVISLFGKASEFFNYLEAGKYDTAHLYFDETERAKITPENLQKLWASVKTQLGDVEFIDPIQSKVQGEFYAVTVEGKFERDAQTFVLMFNKTEKVVGLYMPPKAIAYTKPFYVDTDLYTESSVYLQSPGHQLAAVITVPKNVANFPVVVLVHGSGPSDMDGTVGPNKPLKDIATGLASKGIGSVRYVKRTVIYAAEFAKAFTVKEEVIDDAVAAIALAKTVKGADLKNIYLFGHSLGGMLAPRIASLAPDLKGMIIAAAPARKLTDIIVEQNKYIIAQAKDTTGQAQKYLDEALKTIEGSRITKLSPTLKADSVIIGLPASYWVDLNSYNQVAAAKASLKKVLIIQGGNDFQVSETDFNLWKAGLAGKTNATFKFYPEINHLLSAQLEKGNSSQYQTMVNVAENVVKDIAAWIKQ
jgi:dienelactone hydrolase